MHRLLAALLVTLSACVIIHDDDDGDPGSGATCGGFAGFQCETDEFCDFPQNTCSVADEPGVCRARPTACDEIFQPVTGCDGETYDNPCFAHAAGTDVSGPGPQPL